ncbi:hypothetical protein Tsubulata_015786 [Turnera subulata]|uniref:Prolamin-like domain-containing protein n=1 Tax=Turnera subulata TaxID=218843 RepID=A0A9Q0FUK3_9ROSI|nr:hypothetical protein Tsubulata_015786 [Turnera subulata]
MARVSSSLSLALLLLGLVNISQVQGQFFDFFCECDSECAPNCYQDRNWVQTGWLPGQGYCQCDCQCPDFQWPTQPSPPPPQPKHRTPRNPPKNPPKIKNPYEDCMNAFSKSMDCIFPLIGAILDPEGDIDPECCGAIKKVHGVCAPQDLVSDVTYLLVPDIRRRCGIPN